MSGVQRVQSTVPSPRRVTKRGARESQLVEASGAPSIKRLDGEVVKERKLTFAGGTCREVWVGRWKRSSREGDREKECWEKVGLWLTTPLLLKWLFTGRFESTQVIGEYAKGLAFASRRYTTSSRIFSWSLGSRT